MKIQPPDIALDNPFEDDPETRDCQWLVLYFCISVSKLEDTHLAGLRPAWLWALPWAHLSSGTGLLSPLSPLSAADLASRRIERSFSRRIEAAGLLNMPPFSGLIGVNAEFVDAPGSGRTVWRTITALTEPLADPVKASLEARTWIDEILLTSCPWAPPALECPAWHGRASKRQDTAAFAIASARARLEKLDIERDTSPASGSAFPAWVPRM